MKKYPRWIIRKFVRVPGEMYETTSKSVSLDSLWEIGYIRQEGDKPYINVRRPTYEEVRRIYIAGTERRDRQNATWGT